MEIKSIHFTSRASVKIGDSFFTVEYGEDRQLDKGDNYDAEVQNLINDCNNQVDNQILEIKEMFNNKNRH
jgi:hypothetical protein